MKKKLVALFLTVAMLVTPLTAFAAGETEVVALMTPSVRVELLSDSVVRVEAADASGNFDDRETLIAYSRDDFTGVSATVSESDTEITAVTDKYTVTVKKDTALAADAVSIYGISSAKTFSLLLFGVRTARATMSFLLPGLKILQ